MMRFGQFLWTTLSVAVLSLALPGATFVASGQAGEVETLVTTDGALQLSYPADWRVNERPDGAIDLDTDEAFLTIYTPNYLAVSGLFPADMSSTSAFLDSFKETASAAGVMTFDQSVKAALNPQLTAMRSDFVFSEQGSETPAGQVQFMLAVPVDDHFVLVMAVGPDDETFTDDVYAMAESFVILNDATPAPGTSAQSEAAGLPMDWREIVPILESAGLITGEGELLWSASYLSTSVGGPFVMPDDSLSDYPNVAGGALVSFRPDSDERVCGLLARYMDTDGAEQLLFIGLDADYQIMMVDAGPDNADDPQFNNYENDLSFFNPQQLLYVLRDNKVTVLINGETVVEEAPVALPEADAKGAVPPGYAGAALEMSCVMTDAWAYGFRDE